MYVDNQFVNGRGTIAYVEYTGDDAAAEIKKLLSAVVSTYSWRTRFRAD